MQLFKVIVLCIAYWSNIKIYFNLIRKQNIHSSKKPLKYLIDYSKATSFLASFVDEIKNVFRF